MKSPSLNALSYMLRSHAIITEETLCYGTDSLISRLSWSPYLGLQGYDSV
jgi:hypothetical protein